MRIVRVVNNAGAGCCDLSRHICLREANFRLKVRLPYSFTSLEARLIPVKAWPMYWLPDSRGYVLLSGHEMCSPHVCFDRMTHDRRQACDWKDKVGLR